MFCWVQNCLWMLAQLVQQIQFGNSQQMLSLTKIIIKVSLYFFILFTAYNSLNSIVTRVREEQGDNQLAPFFFCVNYTFFMISNLFAPLLNYSQKWQMTVAGLAYTFNYFTNIFIVNSSETVKYILVFIGATINGLFASILWVSVGRYIHNACHHQNDLQNKGYYYGLFNTIYSFSNLVSGIVIMFGLKLMSHEKYFILITGIGVFSVMFSIIFIKNIRQSKSQEKVSDLSMKKILLSTLKFYPTMISVLGLIFVDGINIGVQTSTLVHLIPKTDDEKQDNFYSGICLLSSGVGCFIGGYLGGKLCDIFPIKKIAYSGIFLYILACILIFIASFIEVFPFSLLASFVLGFEFYYIEGCLMVICSRIFQGVPESFAIVKQFHCISFILYEIVAMTTSNSIQIKYIMPFILIFTIPALIGLRKLPAQKIKKQSLLQSQSNQQI